MPLPEDQRRALAEVVIRSRRMYRVALRMQTDDAMADDRLADLYIDSQLVATYCELLWRQSGERYRARLATPSPQEDTALDNKPHE